jgi:pimeloyl-ACP methyl ester carboxylesterase
VTGGRARVRCALLLTLLLGASGCAWMYSAPVPLHTERSALSATGRASTLMVLMPGRGDDASAFAEHGFVQDVRAAGLPVDILAVDARIGYYMKETIVDRMRIDVLEPARAQGYKQIWIVGASMGGLGSLIVASRLPGAVDRIFLLSPYLGPDRLVRQIEAAGGPARWTPTDLSDPYQRIWQWLKQYSQPGAPMPPMMLGFARQEGMAPNHRVLAQLLPADRVFEVDGKHGWVAWRQLWQRAGTAIARGQ